MERVKVRERERERESRRESNSVQKTVEKYKDPPTDGERLTGVVAKLREP